MQLYQDCSKTDPSSTANGLALTMIFRMQRMLKKSMTVHGTVAKDVLRNIWKSIPKAMEAIEAEWNRLRAHNVWHEAHLRTLGSVQNETKRNNKTIHIGRLFDFVSKTTSILVPIYATTNVEWHLGNHVRDDRYVSRTIIRRFFRNYI